MSNPVDDLFSDNPAERATAVAVVGEQFESLTAHPAWSLYTRYLKQVRRHRAVEFAVSGEPTLALHMQGYIKGMDDAISSVVALVEHAQNLRRKESEEDDRRRQGSLPLFARGGVR